MVAAVAANLVNQNNRTQERIMNQIKSLNLIKRNVAASLPNIVIMAAMALSAGLAATNACAQAAGAGASFNRTDRAATAAVAERQRLERIDTPIRPDPLGNALLGGPVHGVIRGAAVGLTSIVTGTATGAALQRARGAK